MPTNIDRAMADIVNAFLKWPLPKSVCSDRCVTIANEPHRSGTNLLTCPETVMMVEEVVRPIVNRLLAQLPLDQIITKELKLPNPDAMHGAADEFGGSDYP